ncbi:hypothetical protein ACFL1L_01090 [Thermoplasmatota archaeon]
MLQIEDKGNKIIKILKKEKTQKILQYWKDKPDKWVRSCKLREHFVKDYQKNKHSSVYKNKSQEKTKSFNKNTDPIYKNDSQFYRDILEMKSYDILQSKKEVQKKGKPHVFYQPSKKYQEEGIRIENKSALNIFPKDQIIEFSNNRSNSKQIIYGISKNHHKHLNSNDQETIKKSLKIIEQQINKIKKIKYEKIMAKIEEKLEKIYTQTKSKQIKNLIETKSGLLLGIIDMTIISNIDHIAKLPKKIFTYNIEQWSKYQSVREFKLSYNDVEELSKWAWRNRNFFLSLHPYSIAFSSYKEYESNPFIKDNNQ